MTTTTTTTTTNKEAVVVQHQRKTEGHCDICWGSDGFQKLILRQCSDCGVKFHNECYGLKPRKDSTTIRCWACQSVGTSIKGIDPVANKVHKIKQTSRPTECALCSVDDGGDYLHAMHGLYTEIEPRQIVLPADRKTGKEKRLAWVHTLCALSINCNKPTGGCVFASALDGSYMDADDDDDDDNVVVGDTTDKETKLADVHHFGFCLKPKNEPDTPWTKRIGEQQMLRCTICGTSDNRTGVYRMALQCSANDAGEYEEFQGCHKELGDSDCVVPMHVGCAMWAKTDMGLYPSVRRIYFFPGAMTHANKQTRKPVANMFCQAHASDLKRCHRTGSTVTRYPSTSIGMHNSREDKEWDPPAELSPQAAKPAKATAAKKAPAESSKEVLPPKKVANSDLMQKVVDDVVERLRPLTTEDRDKTRTEKYKYWKKELDLPSDEFKRLWSRARKQVTTALASIDEDVTSNNSASTDTAVPDKGSAKTDATHEAKTPPKAKVSVPAPDKATVASKAKTPPKAKVAAPAANADSDPKKTGTLANAAAKPSGLSNPGAAEVETNVPKKRPTKKTDETPTKKMRDWSFLLVGKNYNPDGLDFQTWDTYVERPGGTSE